MNASGAAALRMEPGAAALRMEGVSKAHGRGRQRVLALNQVDLEIQAGEFVAIIGPSGSGKSTLLHLAGAMDQPDEGTVWVAGHATSGLDDDALTLLRRQSIGFVFQFFHLLPTLSIEENVALPRLIAGERLSDLRLRILPLVERLGLADRVNNQASELSGGEMQRVALARALIIDPAILLLDEPTGNLDQETGSNVLDLLAELHRMGPGGQGPAVVMVTHDAAAAARAQRVLELRDGRFQP